MTSHSTYIILPEPPTANTYWRVWKGRAVLSTEGRGYKQNVEARWLRVFGNRRVAFPAPAEVSVHLVWARGRKSGDLDNRIKPTLDALKGLAFTDDKQVVAISAERIEGKDDPRIEVRVSAYHAASVPQEDAA